jgi:hypothetical protein
MGPVGSGIDWREAEAYAPLLDADRSIFAWEWLRRDPGYRRAALAAGGPVAGTDAARPDAWGLCAFEHPDAAAPRARPLWKSAIHPAVLEVVVECRRSGADSVDLRGFGGLVIIAGTGCGTEHVLISDGLRAIRLDIVDGSIGTGLVQLRYLLAGMASVESRLPTLLRFLAFCRTGRFSRSLHSAETRAGRWLTMLRAHDAMAIGANQREIAAVLLNPEAAQPKWRVGSPSLRSRVQRLVRGASLMAGGGYRALLKDRGPSAPL